MLFCCCSNTKKGNGRANLNSGPVWDLSKALLLVGSCRLLAFTAIGVKMMLCSGISRARKAKIAIGFFFFSQGLTFGNFGGILPAVKELHDVSNPVLGAILVAAVFGGLIAMPIISYLSKRFGSSFSLFLGALLFLLLINLIGVDAGLILFAASVVSLGFGACSMDVSVNCQGVLCEKMTRTPTLGLFHCLASFGSLVGALTAGALLQIGFSVLGELIIVSIIQIPFVLILSCWLYSYQEERLINGNGLLNYEGGFRYSRLESTETPLDLPKNMDVSSSNSNSHHSSMAPSVDSKQIDWQVYDPTKPAEVNRKVLIGISLLCMFAYFGQGSISDWSAIFLTEAYDASPIISVSGLAGFQLCICLGTYLSDDFVARWDRQSLLVLGGLVSCLGLLLVSFSPVLTDNRDIGLSIATVGFSVFGLGSSVVPPSVISIAGSKATGMSPNDAIAWVSSAGYVGIMIGPALLGGISGLCDGLQWSFLVVAGFMVLITIITKFMTLEKTQQQESMHSLKDLPDEIVTIQ